MSVRSKPELLLGPHPLTGAAFIVGILSYGFGPAPGIAGLLALGVFWILSVLSLDERVRTGLRQLVPTSPAGPVPAATAAAAAALASIAAGWLAASQLLVALLAVLGGLCLWRPLGAAASGNRHPRELDRWFVLLAGSLLLIRPYLTTHLVGAGDAEHYVRQLKDFLEQVGAGVFPVFIGQGYHSFGGEVHPLRLAPYFQYLGGLVHVLTGLSLHPAALQNLLIASSHLAAVFTCYAALTRFLEHRWACLWLALLFASSPGVLALIYGGDMVLSWLTLPWLPLLFAGCVRTWEETDPGRGLVQQAIALGMIWLAHPPIAFWAGAVAGTCWLARLAVRRSPALECKAGLGAAVLCGAICHYVFVSTATLELPENPYLTRSLEQGLIGDTIRENWGGLFRTVSADGSRLLTDLHLSPGLWLAAGLFLLLARAGRGAGLALSVSAAVLLVLTSPVPGVTDAFWRHVPGFVLTVTEKWPMQRFYPIVSLLIPLALALGMRHRWLDRVAARRAVLVLLAAGVAWSVHEAGKFVRHARAVTRSQEATVALFAPENSRISSYSYEYFGRLPRHFQFTHMDPAMQTRLWDPAGRITLESNERALQALAPQAAGRVTLRAIQGEGVVRFSPRLSIPPGASLALLFDFNAAEPAGTVLLRGRNLRHQYEIPPAGGEFAFGALPAQGRILTIRNPGPVPDEVEVTLALAGGSVTAFRAVEVTAFPFEPAALPFRLTRLIPYTVEVDVTQTGIVESPKLNVPGYHLTVDGKEREIHRSPDNLVSVPVQPGRHRIEVRYAAPLALAGSFWLNALAMVALAGVAAAAAAGVQPASGLAERAVRLEALGRIGTIGAVTAACGLAVFLGLRGLGGDSQPPEAGSVHLSAKFPVGKDEMYEPLVTFVDAEGHTTAIDAFYENGRHIRIGVRKDGVLVVLTNALTLPISYFVAHRLDVFCGLLLTADDRARFPGIDDSSWQQLRQALRIEFNDTPVIETTLSHPGNRLTKVLVGEDPFPRAVQARFTGEVVSTRGIPRP